jgi:hypothetical protein
MGQCSNTVHDGVYQSLQLLDPVLSKVLMLIMQPTLPIIDAVSPQDFLDLVTYFHLGSITYKLRGGSPSPDLVFQSIDELPISLNGIDISDKGLHTNKNLGYGGTRVNSWGVRVDGVHGNWLIPPVNIQSGKRRFVLLFEEGAHRKSSILSRYFKSLLDNISRKPFKHRQKCLVVRSMLVDLMGMRLIQSRKHVQS